MILIILVILAPKPIEAITGNCPDGGTTKLKPAPSPIIKRLAMFKLAETQDGIDTLETAELEDLTDDSDDI